MSNFNANAAFAGGVRGAGSGGSSGSAAGSVTFADSNVAQLSNVGPSPVSNQDIRNFFDVARTPGEIAVAALQNNIPSTRIARVLNLSESQRQQFFRDNPEIPKFAKGGMHSGGLRIVGDGGGPELEATGPSRIHSSNDLRQMLSNDDMVEQIVLLITAVKENTEFNRRVSKKLDDVTTTDSKNRTALRTGTGG